jgi:hypothetical protein
VPGAGVTGRRFDPASLVAGLAVSGLGVLLLLDQVDAVDLRFGYFFPAIIGVVGAILLAVGLTGRR